MRGQAAGCVAETPLGNRHAGELVVSPYAGRPTPCPSSHSTQYVPKPLKHLILAGLPHLHVIAGNVFAALGAGMS